jgi:hypothetical protein
MILPAMYRIQSFGVVNNQELFLFIYFQKFQLVFPFFLLIFPSFLTPKRLNNFIEHRAKGRQ